MSEKINIVELPFHEILADNGYYEKRDKSCQNSKVMKNDHGDMVVITKKPNGHYLYFNPNDYGDRGNIVTFCKNRGISTHDLIQNTQYDYDNIEKAYTKYDRLKDNASKEIYIDYTKIDSYNNTPSISEKSFLVSKRAISNAVLCNFSDLKEDERHNILAPSYIYNSRILNLTKAGYISYLSNPITKDKDGRPYDRPLKQLCYGAKGLEIIVSDNADRKHLDSFKSIIITESMIDSLAYMQINSLDPKTTLLCSTNGQITQAHKDVFKFISDRASKNTEIVLGFDNDEAGKGFAKIASEMLPNAKRISPITKDFSDDLVIGKAMGLPLKYSKKQLQRGCLEIQRRAIYLNNKFDLLFDEDRRRLLAHMAQNDIPIVEKIENKIASIFDFSEAKKMYKEITLKLQNSQKLDFQQK